MIFEDRIEAAYKLLPRLKKYAGFKDAILLAIPRGALELGAVLRDELKIPLDIVVTKKISAPGNEEYAIGSVAPDGTIQINEAIVRHHSIPKSYITGETERLKHVIKRRYEDYRGNAELPNLKNKIVIVVDDGIATGFTTLAAVHYIRSQKPKKLVLAVPVAAADAIQKLTSDVDELICLDTPDNFYAVGQFYKKFPQVEDSRAKELLAFTPVTG